MTRLLTPEQAADVLAVKRVAYRVGEVAEMLTPEQVAERLRVSRSKVIAMARGGGLPHVRVGREYRFPEAQLHAWIAEHTSYTRADGEATGTGQRRRVGVPGARPPQALGGKRRRGMEPGGSPDPAGALRIVRAGG